MYAPVGQAERFRARVNQDPEENCGGRAYQSALRHIDAEAAGAELVDQLQHREDGSLQIA